MPLRPLSDLAPADWFVGASDPSLTTQLGPVGFAAYARLLNPLTGLVPGQRQEGNLDPAMLRGLVEVLARHTTTPHDTTFALWSGEFDERRSRPAGLRLFGKRRPPLPTPEDPFAADVMDAPRLQLADLDFALFGGPVSWAGEWGERPYPDGSPRTLSSPQLMWPADHAWFVASEIDTPWTGIGGSQVLIDELAGHPGLEIVPTTYGPQHDPDEA